MKQKNNIENSETDLPLKKEHQPKETFFHLLKENKFVIPLLTLIETDTLKGI
ncbi:hypothetical protein [Polaribacter sp. Hel1_85]|uniref:hypothetical protein n=1 Tax=Polaribacter sp. Hel1_85 TaxID=1250005 RepID=UPI00052E3DD0|nr:hypothetical protein [Polaribacter sp. Hel1_85]KGL63147.1 hypothetical protein PHEL85_0180 [Polaribacter sp. Hel1_85]